MRSIAVAAFLVFFFSATAHADFEAGIVKFEQGDFAAAYRELFPAAEGGEPGAQYILGVMALNGLYGAMDAQSAVEWFRQAAEQNHIESQVELARMYRDGNGVPRDLTEMVVWYSAAAAGGHVGAQIFVADAYAYGSGVEADLVESYMWFEIAGRYWGDLVQSARERVAAQMSDAQIAEALRRAQERFPLQAN